MWYQNGFILLHLILHLEGSNIQRIYATVSDETLHLLDERAGALGLHSRPFDGIEFARLMVRLVRMRLFTSKTHFEKSTAADVHVRGWDPHSKSSPEAYMAAMYFQYIPVILVL